MPSSIRARGKKGIWWYYGHWNGTQRRFSLKTTQKLEAEYQQRQFDARFVDTSFQAPKRKNPTCDEFWSMYSTWMREHREPATLDVQTIFWNQLRAFTRAKRLGDFRQEDFEAFKNHRRKKGIAPRSINNALKDYQAMFNRAIKEKWYNGINPVVDVERYTVTQGIPDWHSQEDLERLVELAELNNRNLHWAVLLTAFAGLRKKELVYLKWDSSFDWDENKPLIKIARHAEFKIKTHLQRNIPMPRRIYETISPHVMPSGYVFNSDRPSSGHGRYRWDCKKSLVSILEEASLPTDDPFQRLRRTFGSMHIRKGRPYALVATWMGNSEAIVRKHYQGLMPYDEAINDV